MNDQTPMDSTPFDPPIIQRPDPDKKQTPLEAFYHMFNAEKFDWETELEFKERVIVREGFVAELSKQGYTPSEFLALLNRKHNNGLSTE